jgi:putative component of membrane protein insertase Oxa1/YidC/SpoIIIJ protein YidD
VVKRTVCGFLVFVMLVVSFLLVAGDSEPAPASDNVSMPVPVRLLSSSPDDTYLVNEIHIIAKLALEIYQHGISPQDRSACIFEPSCSQYMKEALSALGIRGFFMGLDRLHRCHPLNAAWSEAYPRNDQLKLIDPIRKP